MHRDDRLYLIQVMLGRDETLRITMTARSITWRSVFMTAGVKE
jgi:hypothetical protein